MKLFLDDERFPPTDGTVWAIVRSYDEAVTFVKERGFPEFISFDNDLGLDSKEGWQFAQWLIDFDLDCRTMPDNFTFAVHSQNSVRAKDIADRLNRYIQFKKDGV